MIKNNIKGGDETTSRELKPRAFRWRYVFFLQTCFKYTDLYQRKLLSAKIKDSFFGPAILILQTICILC